MESKNNRSLPQLSSIILEELKIQRLDGFLKTREDEAAYVLARFPSEEKKGE